jgi:hypothetical protein
LDQSKNYHDSDNHYHSADQDLNVEKDLIRSKNLSQDKMCILDTLLEHFRNIRYGMNIHTAPSTRTEPLRPTIGMSSTNDQKPTPEATLRSQQRQSQQEAIEPLSQQAIIKGTANRTYEQRHQRYRSMDGPPSQPQQTSDNTPHTQRDNVATKARPQ